MDSDAFDTDAFDEDAWDFFTGAVAVFLNFLSHRHRRTS